MVAVAGLTPGLGERLQLGTTANVTVSNLPNSPGLAGLLLHVQMLALDPAANAFGAVTSDAIVGMTGVW